MPALYGSLDCLQRCKDAAQLPDVDESMTDAAWYRLLTDSQLHWYGQVATIAPGILYGDPEQLQPTGSADGVTYDFGLDDDNRPVVPFGPIKLYRSEDDARQPDAGGYALARDADYSVQGERVILSPTRGLPSLPDGVPWARYIEPPGVIDAGHEPTLLPVEARRAMVLSAVEAWARQGGLRDPAPYADLARQLWFGDPRIPADIGLAGNLQLQYPNAAPSWGGYGRRVRVRRFSY